MIFCIMFINMRVRASILFCKGLDKNTHSSLVTNYCLKWTYSSQGCCPGAKSRIKILGI